MNNNRSLKSSHVSQDPVKKETESPGASETAKFIAKRLMKERKTAEKAGFTFLAFLIDMAVEEASRLRDRL